ncbi:MAG: ATP-binding cassette domain-containing protein [Bacteroidetes bacterium]|nr:ATP-binding cassette domain-containing protein [Bacteroidota bacterium]
MGINVRNLVKEYGSQRAVDDISFEVRTGDILGFLGPNGAGKSTTMKIITCYLRPNSGSVDLDGYNIEDHANEVRRRIGYLPENNPLYLEMSIVDYLAYSAALNQVEKNRINSRVREMIEITGLTKERHKLIGELSKGYRQRVGLAQALIHDPDVLILDEPTTGLDPNQIVEIRSLIKEIGKEKTIMLSSHILQEVEATCDRIIIINQGKIAADATTADLKRRASGAERVRVQIAANGSAVGDALLALPGVSAIERDHDSKEDLWVIDSKPNQPVREQIFKLCVENNWILMQMTPVHTSLEDIFRQLTNKN